MGLLRRLEQHPDISVVAAGSHNGEGLDHCQAHSPLVLVCDGDCERLPVQQLTRRLGYVSPTTRPLVVGGESLDAEMVLRWGGWGVISRSSPGDLYVKAVRVIAGGEYWVGRDVMSRLARKALHPEQGPRKPNRLLSNREAEILRLVSGGDTNDQIAETLFIETNTVRTHLRRIYQKLKVHDRTSAVVMASRNGYIELSVADPNPASRRSRRDGD